MAKEWPQAGVVALGQQHFGVGPAQKRHVGAGRLLRGVVQQFAQEGAGVRGIDDQQLAQQIESAVQMLRGNDREIILMRHYEQLNNQEIAQSLGLTEPAASMRYLRALKRLREIIESMPALQKDLEA